MQCYPSSGIPATSPNFLVGTCRNNFEKTHCVSHKIELPPLCTMERRVPYQMTPENLDLVLPEAVANLPAMQDFVFEPCKSCGKKFVLARPIQVRSSCWDDGCKTTNFCSVVCHGASFRPCGCNFRRRFCPCRECKGSDCEVRLCSSCSHSACSGCGGEYCSQICEAAAQCNLCTSSECGSCTRRCPTCGTDLCSACGKDGCLYCRLGEHKHDCEGLIICYCCCNATCLCRVSFGTGYTLCEVCTTDGCQICRPHKRSKH